MQICVRLGRILLGQILRHNIWEAGFHPTVVSSSSSPPPPTTITIIKVEKVTTFSGEKNPSFATSTQVLLRNGGGDGYSTINIVINTISQKQI
jgi:hypothetical protein